MTPSIGKFSVSQEFSNNFAQASGDFNPLHVDPVVARRYQFGSTVIHGVCGTLKALDIVLSRLDNHVSIKNINVQFNRPIRHNETVEIVCNNLSTGNMRIELYVSKKRVQALDIELINIEQTIYNSHKYELAINTIDDKPLELDYKDSLTIDNDIDLLWNHNLMESLFPKLKEFIPDCQVAILLALTRIVGMNCPGLHSVFAGFTLTFSDTWTDFPNKIHYKVNRNDDRFSLIGISVFNEIVKGEIEALFRPKPVQQPSYNLIKPIVSKGQFSSQRALIIGGTRGVGETTAKLIAAGDGYPVITYNSGKEDAQRVCENINLAGGKCSMVQYNVLSPNHDVVECFDGEDVTHIYYFASPLIEKSNNPFWSEKLFSRFCDFYLSGLADLLEIFSSEPRYRKNELTVFVPSTIYLDQPQKGFTEYISAKAATEAMLNQFVYKYPKWKAMLPRLPRMLTDQTSGVANEEPLHSSKVMHEAIMGRVKF